MAVSITFLCSAYLLLFTARSPTNNRNETAELMIAFTFAKMCTSKGKSRSTLIRDKKTTATKTTIEKTMISTFASLSFF